MTALPLPAWATDDVAMARLALRCLDLTELGDHCTAADVHTLCRKAQGYADRQDVAVLPEVAAVCVWPAFVRQARETLPPHIRVAAVVNFPSGMQSVSEVLAQVETIRQSGGDEVDCVLPYLAWRDGDRAKATALVRAVRHASHGLTLKLIMESGTLSEPDTLRAACDMAMDEGVDFLKTSTGKTPQGASVNAAAIMLDALAHHPASAGRGIKPSGGLRTVADVRPYALAVRERLGEDALEPGRFRIGASGLWNDIARHLTGTPAIAPSAPSTY